MGWGHGTNFAGREIGYSVTAVCDEHGCSEVIDLGLSYCCGGLDGVNGERGCGGYFCGEHLTFVAGRPEDASGQRCERCAVLERCAVCWEDEPDMLSTVDGRVLCEVCVADPPISTQPPLAAPKGSSGGAA